MIPMKARKATIKKPKFLINYFVSLIIVLLIFAVLSSFVFTLAYMEYIYSAEQESELYDVSETIDSYLFENGKEKETLSTEDLNKIKSGLLGVYIATGQRARVYIRNAGVIDSSQTAILYHTEYSDGVKHEEYDPEKYRSYVLTLADEKYMKYFTSPEIKEMWVVDSNHGGDCFELQPELEFQCNKYYINPDKGLFIPVEVEICTANDFTNYKPTGKIINIDPGNTEGYRLVVIEPGVNANFGEVAGFDGVDNDADYESYSTSEGSLAYRTEWTNKKLIPFTTKYKSQVTNAVIVIVWAALAFAFIPASISYNAKRRRYEIFEYRRKMVDAMAHDLKTPMAAISAFAENLSNNIATDKKEYYAGKIEDKVAQMNRMVNDILEFSKSENSNATITKENIDIADVIEKIIADNEHITAERSLKINFEKKSVTVKTDLNLFRMAIANLINNAVLYSKEGTEISITCDEKNLVIINIAEEAEGNANDLKDPFVKGSKARSTGGTGLGLAIANNNLAMLGFKLDVKFEDDRFVATVKL